MPQAPLSNPAGPNSVRPNSVGPNGEGPDVRGLDFMKPNVMELEAGPDGVKQNLILLMTSINVRILW